jgi:murein DD-endopeptidase MepM/ murein hydrolase activator NlpD
MRQKTRKKRLVLLISRWTGLFVIFNCMIPGVSTSGESNTITMSRLSIDSARTGKGGIQLHHLIVAHQNIPKSLNFLRKDPPLPTGKPERPLEFQPAPEPWPVAGQITSGFGYRRNPLTGNREFHEGIDIAAPPGTPIRAPAGGIVVFAGKQRNYGLILEIDHGNGVHTRYAHAARLLKKRGDSVEGGEVVARVGRTGRTTGYHLHYEIHINNKPVNPRKMRFASGYRSVFAFLNPPPPP